MPVPQIGTADLSFRSIISAASKILDLVSEKTLIALVKPQFEVKNRDSLQKGVLKDSENLKSVLIRVVNNLTAEKSYVKDIIMSPIPGRKGNTEFLFYINRENKENMDYLVSKIETLVSKSNKIS